VDDIQDEGVLGDMGWQRFLQGRRAVGKGHAVLEIRSFALACPGRQARHRHRLPCQGRAQLFVHWDRSRGRGRTVTLWSQGRHHLFGAPRIGGNAREAGDDGFLLLGAFLPLAQSHRGCHGRRRPHRDARAIGLHPEDGTIGWPRGRRDQLPLKGRDISSGVGPTGFDGLQAQ